MLDQLKIAWFEYWEYILLVFPKIILGLCVLLLFYIAGRISRIIVQKVITKITLQTIGKNLIVKADLKLSVCKDIQCILDDVEISWAAPTVH